MQTRRQHSDLGWSDAQLSGLGTTRVTFEANNVSPFDIFGHFRKRNTAFVKTHIRQNLQSSALRLQIVESQLVSVFTLSIDTT